MMRGVNAMCRRNFLHGGCLVCFGLGLLIGHWLSSWLLCGCGGMGLVILGLMIMKRR